MRTADRRVHIPVEGVILEGDLRVPDGASALILFVHGSGSSRRSPRNRMVAERLSGAGLGTLLFDLLSEEEEREDLLTRALRFDIGLLTDRVDAATRWLRSEPDLDRLAVGYFGASTGAAAALAASIRHNSTVKAVVSRGGRPDLAGETLPLVTAPCLLIVGSLDTVVIELNRQALGRIRSESKMEIVEGASHLFEEPGTLETASRMAADWFVNHLTVRPSMR